MHSPARSPENMVTGKQREFASGNELLDSIAGDFLASANESSPGKRSVDTYEHYKQ